MNIGEPNARTDTRVPIYNVVITYDVVTLASRASHTAAMSCVMCHAGDRQCFVLSLFMLSADCIIVSYDPLTFCREINGRCLLVHVRKGSVNSIMFSFDILYADICWRQLSDNTGIMEPCVCDVINK